MTGRHYYVDTAVLAYALGEEHPERSAARQVVADATAGTIVLHASVEMVQELLHHRMRRTDRAAALRQARAAAGLCILHPFDGDVLSRALRLVADTRLRGRDAVHAATALLNRVPVMLSPAPDFDGLPGLRRVAPGELTT